LTAYIYNLFGYYCILTLNLLAPTTVGARINPYRANVEKMVSS